MKQASFAWMSAAPEPLDATDEMVTACKCEADAVSLSLAVAFRRFGRNRAQVAQLCGWKSASFLSEIAEPENAKAMPAKRVRAFEYACGIRLVTQFHDRQRILANLAGKPTKRDREAALVNAYAAQWQQVAA